MVVSKKIAAFALLLSAALSAGAVVFLTGRLPVHESFPPGCAREERTLPGCHPTATRITSNTVAAITVIVSPLATLAVALVAVNATRSRQTEQLAEARERQIVELAAERDRLDAQLAHDREIRDREQLRKTMDDILSACDRVRNGVRRAAEKPSEVAALTRAIHALEPVSNSLMARVGSDHPIWKEYKEIWGLVSGRARSLVEAIDVRDEAIRQEKIDAVMDGFVAEYGKHFNRLVQAGLPYVGASVGEAGNAENAAFA